MNKKTQTRGVQFNSKLGGTAPLRRPLPEKKIISPERCTWPV